MPTKQEQLQFSLEVERTASVHRISYLEALMHLCETSGIETEVAAKLITSNLKIKLAADAQNMNLLKIKRASRLPL
jgi:late-transcription coactivator